jgi:hypothetical protein
VRLAAAILAALLAAAGPARAQEAVEVAATPIERFDAGTPVGARYGELVFLGGLKLSARDPDFGGLSGLRLSADGRSFTAISDRGNWFRGELGYDGSRPTGLTNVTRSPTPGRDGRPLQGRRGFDTEGLEIDGRTAYVSSERAQWLTRYALDADGRPDGRGRAVALPKDAASAPHNAGFEAIAVAPDGGILMIAEKHLDADGDNRAFVVGAKAPFSFAVRRSDDFSPTDLVRLPGGGYALLERRFRPPFSLHVRIRKLEERDLRPGAIVDGRVLMEASLAQTIDNFEAIAVHREGGSTVLTVLSDDNFSALQRTLLMQFRLAD